MVVPEIAPGIVNLGAFRGGAGHVSCPGCGEPWFHVENNGVFPILQCAKCNFTIKAMVPNQFDQKGELICPDCKKRGIDQRQMAIIGSNTTICIGCRKCRWELRSSLIPNTEIIL